MWAAEFQALLVSRLRADPSAAKQIKTAKAPVPQYPHSVEAAYTKWIARQLNPIGRYATNALRDRVEGWAAPYRNDSFGAGFATFVQELLGYQKDLFESDPAKRNLVAGVLGFGKKTDKFNYKDFQKQIDFALGTTYHPDEPWVRQVLDSWAADNYKLITNLSTTYITRINQIVSEMVPAGATWKQIAGKLQTLNTTITGARAKLIARDQVGKLNGQLLQRRQTDAGIDSYEWMTANDERVRGRAGGKYPTAVPSHWVMEDKVCRWDNAGVWKSGDDWVARSSNAPTAHPGQPIQCRCTAVPYYDDLVKEAAVVAKDPTAVLPAAVPTPAPTAPPAPPKPPVNLWPELRLLPEHEQLKRFREIFKEASDANPYRGWHAAGSPEDFAQRYKGVFADRVNGDLRAAKGKPVSGMAAEGVKGLDEYIKRYAVSDDYIVYRGMSGQAVADSNFDLTIGALNRDYGYSSSSVARDVAKNFAGRSKGGIIIEFKAPAGSAAPLFEDSAGYNGEELEILMPRGGAFYILGVDRTQQPIKVLAQWVHPDKLPTP